MRFRWGAVCKRGETVIVEYWTDSRRAVVVTGGRAELVRVARTVGVSSDALIPVAPSKVALALWGDALDSYVAAEFGDTLVGTHVTTHVDIARHREGASFGNELQSPGE